MKGYEQHGTTDCVADKSRRRFFKQVGGTAAAMSLGGPGLALAKSATDARPMHIGVVLPDTPHFKGNRRSLLDGMRLGLASLSSEGRLSRLVITHAAVTAGGSGLASAYTDLAQGGADRVLALTSVGAATMHRQSVAREGVPLVVVNAGNDYPRQFERVENIYHASHDQWRAEHGLGAWAVGRFGPRVAVLTSSYDGGYDSPYTFQLGVESAHGRVRQFLLPHGDEVAGLSAQLDAIRGWQADVVYAALSGSVAEHFTQAWSRKGGTPPLLVGRHFMTAERLRQHATPLHGACFASCWSADDDAVENQAFVRDYHARFGREPDGFAALGFETALFLHQPALSTARFRGLGQEVVMDSSTSSLLRAGRIMQIDSHRPNKLRQAGLLESAVPPLATLDSAPRSGLLEPYLCA